MQDRKKILETIIRYEDPSALSNLRQDLKVYGWDSDEELVLLTRGDVISILQRYLFSELTAKEVEDWADAIDIRDDVKFGMGDDEDTVEIVGELANPVVPLTPEFAQKLIKDLKNE